MKTVYFVRHAQTDGNAGEIQLGEDAMLTQEGRNQARKLASRLRDERFDAVFSSTYPRSIETTEILLEGRDQIYRTSELLIERRRPSVMLGRSKKDPLNTQIVDEIMNNFGVNNHRHSDEENFEDLKQRAGRVLELMEQADGEKILCVTHGFFMRIVFARMLFGEQLTAEECKQCIRTMHLENTGIVEAALGDNGWFIWRWNDHDHLNWPD